MKPSSLTRDASSALMKGAGHPHRHGGAPNHLTCTTSRLAAPARPTLMVIGFTRALLAKFWIFLGMVALKRRVCRWPCARNTGRARIYHPPKQAGAAIELRGACIVPIQYLEVGEDGTDVALKTHVDHPVSLIQGQVTADVQAHHLLLQQVHQAARGCHHHVHTTAGRARPAVRHSESCPTQRHVGKVKPAWHVTFPKPPSQGVTPQSPAENRAPAPATPQEGLTV